MTLNLLNRIKRFVSPVIDHPYKTLAVVLIFWFLEWRWGFEAGFFITLFFLFLLLRLDYRILIFFALLFLISCPFYLMTGHKFQAEQMAIYAYYLLFIGTILALAEQMKPAPLFRREKWRWLKRPRIFEKWATKKWSPTAKAVVPRETPTGGEHPAPKTTIHPRVNPGSSGAWINLHILPRGSTPSGQERQYLENSSTSPRQNLARGQAAAGHAEGVGIKKRVNKASTTFRRDKVVLAKKDAL